MRIQNFHLPSCRSAPPGVERRHKNSKGRAPEPLPALGALRGALAFRVRLESGLSRTNELPTSMPVALSQATINVPLVSSLAGRRSRWGASKSGLGVLLDRRGSIRVLAIGPKGLAALDGAIGRFRALAARHRSVEPRRSHPARRTTAFSLLRMPSVAIRQFRAVCSWIRLPGRSQPAAIRAT
jgi:hypothetical protein